MATSLGLLGSVLLEFQIALLVARAAATAHRMPSKAARDVQREFTRIQLGEQSIIMWG